MGVDLINAGEANKLNQLKYRAHTHTHTFYPHKLDAPTQAREQQ